VCLFARWTFPSNWKYFKTILWEKGSRTCKSTKLLTRDRATYNVFVIHWTSLACKQKLYFLLFGFGFRVMEMVVVVYRWSSILVYFQFLSFTRYDFTNFVVFPILWRCKVFTMIMFQSSFNLLGLVILPSNLIIHLPSWDGWTYDWRWQSIPWSSSILVHKSHVLVATCISNWSIFCLHF